MRKIYVKQTEKDSLSDFKQGQIDILNWLELTAERELSKIKTKEVQEILNLSNEEINILRANQKVYQMLLWNIQQTQKAIKNQGK